MTGAPLTRAGRWPALVAAALSRRPESGLPRLRWLLGLFAAGTCGVLAVVALVVGKPLTSAAALAIVVLRVLDMQRGRLGPIVLDPLEGLLLVAVLGGLGIDASSPAAYTALYFRAAYAGRARLAGSVVISVLALEVGAALSMSAPFARAAQHVMGLLFTGFIMRMVIGTLLNREREVTAERELLDAVLESLDVAVVACDPEGRLLHVNRAGRLAGLDPRQAAAAAPGEVSPPVDLTSPVLQPLAHALEGRAVRDREIGTDADGLRRDYVVNAQPVEARDGGRLGAVVALHDVTDRRRAEEQLARQALSDPLTDLPNRLLLRDRLDRALSAAARGHSLPALLFIDLDGFKTVNDSAGHDAGDEVLVAVADRLVGALAPGDTLARLGGDEFAILLEETDPQTAVAVAQRLLPLVAEPLAVRGQDMVVSASVGVAVPERGTPVTSGDLLRNADLAMYAAKETGKGQVRVYDPSMHASVVARTSLERGLRRALDEGEFLLHYQPVVSFETGRVAGVEALVRWQSPDRGLVPPLEFIPLAESSGLIVPIGAWVLNEACRQLAVWDADPASGLAGLRVAVNVSPRQLQAPGLLEEVRDVLARTGIAPQRLTIEITESALGEGAPTLRLVQTLKELGVRLSLDDFGTGYSSLARLRHFPVHTVKIDRSFVQEIELDGEAPLVTATIALAGALGLSTVAEGVETLEQEVFLRHHGCEAAQGYRYSKPVPAQELPGVVRSVHLPHRVQQSRALPA
ncbi:MAG TPA: EAL domain-containing protein [Kineosporiaceae bacterium]|nr:EAL domain-containing protein [Kineosporiaceae bacterium]